MEMFDIHIGEECSINCNSTIPKQVITITKEQLEVIELFATSRKDKDLNTIYKLNDCEFRVYPHVSKIPSSTDLMELIENQLKRVIIKSIKETQIKND